MCPGSAEMADIFSKLQLWPLVSLQTLDQNQWLVPHLKDLFHISLETKAQGFWITLNCLICLGTKAQGFWMTFNVCNLDSNYPYFNRAYVVSSSFGCTHLYILDLFIILFHPTKVPSKGYDFLLDSCSTYYAKS